MSRCWRGELTIRSWDSKGYKALASYYFYLFFLGADYKLDPHNETRYKQRDC